MEHTSRWHSLSIGDVAPTYEYEVTAEAIARFYRSARYENIVYASPPTTPADSEQPTRGIPLPVPGVPSPQGGSPGIVAPPAMALVYAPIRSGWFLLDAGGVAGIPGASGNVPTPTVDVEIEFQGELVIPGDVVSSVTSVSDKGEKDGGCFLTLQVIAHNQREELVARIRCTYRWATDSAANN